MAGDPSYWLNEDPTVEEFDGFFHLVLRSGEQNFRFVVSPRIAGLLGHRATSAVATFQSRQAAVIPFPVREGGDRQGRARKPRQQQ